jgi:LysM repeat protein
MDPRRIVIVLLLALGLSGCVTKENYNTQVLRTNNFQRLLSEEEKRTVELSTEIARLKDQMASMETKNKALTAQLNDSKAQVVRSLEEVGRLQDEVKQARGGFSSVPALRGPSQEPPDRLGELQERPAARPDKPVEPKKGKAEAKAKVQKQSEVPPPAPQLKAEPSASAPTTPPAPLLREPSQEPPDRLGELQEKPAARPDKPVEPKKGKAEAKAKVQKQSQSAPPQPSQPRIEMPVPVSPASSEPLLRAPSQEPPDRLVEMPEAPAVKPAAKSDKKVEPKKGKATAKIKIEKQGEEPRPSSPPKAEAPAAPPPPPPAKAETKQKVQTKTETEAEAIPDDSFFRYHKVKKGETLAGIAKQYRTDAQTLRELNDMASGDAVKPGDRLIVGQKQ